MRSDDTEVSALRISPARRTAVKWHTAPKVKGGRRGAGRIRQARSANRHGNFQPQKRDRPIGEQCYSDQAR
jgi:hypothetical protein